MQRPHSSRSEWTVLIHTVIPAVIFGSNQSDRLTAVYVGSATRPVRNKMSETRKFDIKLIEEVKNVPALWDSRVEEYKLADRKSAMWVQIADKLGSSASIIIATTLAQ